MLKSSRTVKIWGAYGATLLALAYAAVSIYWALGGRLGIRSVGGSIAQLAGSGTVAATTVVWVTAFVKIACGFLSCMLARNISKPKAFILRFNQIIAAVLIAYGSTLVVAAALVELHIIHPHSPVDWYALGWHLALWDLWFLIWGLLLAIAAV